jgi:hypothetical protein
MALSRLLSTLTGSLDDLCCNYQHLKLNLVLKQLAVLQCGPGNKTPRRNLR